MEGTVDENNRSLLPNPFVSTVLIHLSIPSPPPTSFTLPQPELLHQALPAHKQLTVPQLVKEKYSSSPLTKTQLRFNSAPFFILFIFLAAGNKYLFWRLVFYANVF